LQFNSYSNISFRRKTMIAQSVTSNTKLILELKDETSLEGTVSMPDFPRGVIIMCQLSSNFLYNDEVIDFLNHNHFLTVNVDLLTRNEFLDFDKRFDLEMLTERLVKIINWTKENFPYLSDEIGLVGSGKGAAVALKAAAEFPGLIKTIVSRSGRPDLVENILGKVKCPVLFVTGKLDPETEEANYRAKRKMRSRVQFVSITGASHLLYEYGKRNEFLLEMVDWFDGIMVDKREELIA